MSEYMNIEALRLRAERAETKAHSWRAAAYVLLALLVVQTWLVVDTAMSLRQARQFAAQADSRAIERGAAAAKAEGMFRTCKAANAGLFEGIKEQQVLLKEAIQLAKRCQSRPSVLWTAGNDGLKAVADHEVADHVHLFNDLRKGGLQ